jgi:hypothetical protein
MPYGLKRTDLRAIAQVKLDDAVLLIKHMAVFLMLTTSPDIRSKLDSRLALLLR